LPDCEPFEIRVVGVRVRAEAVVDVVMANSKHDALIEERFVRVDRERFACRGTQARSRVGIVADLVYRKQTGHLPHRIHLTVDGGAVILVHRTVGDRKDALRTVDTELERLIRWRVRKAPIERLVLGA
jgi:hypothetical protein